MTPFGIGRSGHQYYISQEFRIKTDAISPRRQLKFMVRAALQSSDDVFNSESHKKKATRAWLLRSQCFSNEMTTVTVST